MSNHPFQDDNTQCPHCDAQPVDDSVDYDDLNDDNDNNDEQDGY